MKKIIALTYCITILLFSKAQSIKVEWVKQLDSCKADKGRSITVDDAGNSYVTGNFSGTVDFDPGPGTANLTAAGAKDIFILKLDATGKFIWAKAMGGAANESPSAIALDAQGNVYTTGYFEKTADFDPGVGVVNLTVHNHHDIFISKLDNAGNFVWAKGIGPAGLHVIQATAIKIDAKGNVYTSGYFYGGADFDPGAEVFDLYVTSRESMFLLKLTAAGTFVWVKKLDTDYSEAYAITTDALNNVYTTGSFQTLNRPQDIDPGPGTYYLSSDSGSIFILKLDSTGNFGWARNVGKLSSSTSIAADHLSNVYITGLFREGDFDPGPAKLNLISAGISDIFILKLNALGNFVWAKTMGGTKEDEAKCLSVDAIGNVYTTGSFEGMADFDPGKDTFELTAPGTDTSAHYFPKSAFTSVIDSSGNFVWAKNMDEVSGHSIIADNFFNIYTTSDSLGIQKAKITTTAIEERNINSDIILYPNPTAGPVHLRSLDLDGKDRFIEVYNNLGALIYKQKYNTGLVTFSLGDLSDGLYFVVVRTNNKITTHKVVKR